METGMTVAKLLEARRIFTDRDVAFDDDKSFFMVIPRRQIIRSFKGNQKRYAKWKLFLRERKQWRQVKRERLAIWNAGLRPIRVIFDQPKDILVLGPSGVYPLRECSVDA